MTVDKVIPPADRYKIRRWETRCPLVPSHETTPLERVAGKGLCAVCGAKLTLVAAAP